ncbi:MAG: DUF5723 family protein [Bacteroides sp.]|nr:DUF5723 family protein [Bacteroides sp.]MCM1379966.1 DUF5723 family protein [Bacteroides sp.]MCM1446279.1 DUF5723 family protein [Prevotella sp.]
MNNKIKSLMCVAMVAATSFTAVAQNRSAYFLDNYAYRYQMNPAMGRDGKFDISFPGLGNFNFGISSNFGLNSFLYNKDGKTVTFLHPDISASEAMSKIPTRSRLGFDLREGILSVGFKGLGGYNHISINAVGNAQVRLPKGLFQLAKEGIENKNYEIGRVDLHADAYAEIALNHSHDLGKLVPGLTVGGSLKFLVGVANIDVNMNRADLNLGTDSWRVITDGAAQVSLGEGFVWRTNSDGQIDGMDMETFNGPSGFGMAIDLGATYKWKDFTFALAFNDLGFISWNSTMKAGTNGEHTFDTNNYEIDPGNFDDSFDKMKDDFTDLYDLRPEEGSYTRTRAIEATMNASVMYTLPVYKQLTFGLLNTTRMAHRFAWTEFRINANIMPAKWFGFAVNYGIGTFGSSFGWIINFAPKGVNLYFGMDRMFTKTTKDFIPYNANAQLSFGLNFPI